MCSVEGTDQLADWFGRLSRRDQVSVEAALEWIDERGPGLAEMRKEGLLK